MIPGWSTYFLSSPQIDFHLEYFHSSGCRVFPLTLLGILGIEEP